MNYLWFVATFVLLVLWMYIASCFKVPNQVVILQTTLQDFRFDMLREKQPVVIQDQIVSLPDIQKMWFSPNIVSSYKFTTSQVWEKNKSKFMVFCAREEGDLYLYPMAYKWIDGAPDPQETLIAIHMKPQQLVIVPFGWHYLTQMEMDGLEVNDYLSIVLKAFV